MGDQELLYDNSTVYFTMEQKQKPRSNNSYILSFNCRSFSLWAEFDPYCWKENLSLHSLSQYNVFKSMVQRQQLVVHIKSKKYKNLYSSESVHISVGTMNGYHMYSCTHISFQVRDPS